MKEKQYILSLSYGKDSLACLEAIKLLALPLDRIIHAEVWATDTIPADLPPMVEFKKKADKIIKERYGIAVEHIAAVERERERVLSYEDLFYREFKTGKRCGTIYGFPFKNGAWCNSGLKTRVLDKLAKVQEADTSVVHYLGIAADEPERIKRHSRPGIILPLVEIGWDEAYCRKWCEENDLLSPIYTDVARGGCWFCHNQSVSQLRLLRKNYPDLWKLLLKWDNDSPVSFKPDGHTVHDYDKRFQAEDEGRVPIDRKFRWKMLKEDKP